MKPKQKKNENQKKKLTNYLIYKPATSPKNLLAGKWRIIKMTDFNQKDVDEEVKAHIIIERGGCGEFQFILVRGDISGEFSQTQSGALFDFTWLGNDECDEASGDGWIHSMNGTKAEGKIRFHCGDTYEFQAKKIFPPKKHQRKYC